MSTQPRECTVCGEENASWRRRDEVADRLARGAPVSVEVGPCPDCGYVWKADPRASTAKCPKCSDAGPGDAEPPTVSVADEASLWECRECGSTRGGRQ